MTDGWTERGGVRLHYLEHGRGHSGPVPVVVVPGMGERATEYEWLLEALPERHTIAVDVRGRGPSDAPGHGYRWEDHAGDVVAAVDAAGLDRPVLVGFSRGSSYLLGYLFAHHRPARGLVVGDYAARHVGLPPEVLPRQLEQVLRGVPMSERMPEVAVRGVVMEGQEVPLWDRLAELAFPVLVVRGGRRGSMVSDEVAAQWRAALPSVEIALLEHAGHDLWSRDRDAYLAVLRPFLARVDAAVSTI